MVSDSWLHTSFLTAFGWVEVIASEQGIWKVTLPQTFQDRALTESPVGRCRKEVKPGQLPFMEEAMHFLQDYYAGEMVEFSSLPLDMRQSTAFQRDVWSAARQIPYGAWLSYGELARRSGHPGAGRAAGNALALNRWPPLVPCHRVLRSDGSLGGFRGGVELKRRMLLLESIRHERLHTA